ncbi:MAG: hypothetical protein AAFR61_16760 [Bacteroidota bacterium]
MNDILKYLLAFGLYLFFQVSLFNGLVLFNMAVPFIFILFALSLPFQTPTALMYGLAFGCGLLVDMLSDDAATGLHAFSLLLAVSQRPFFARLVSSTNFRSLEEMSFKNQSAIWYILYLAPLIFIHHFAYFFLESLSFQNFFYKLLQVFTSSIYTLVISYILCLLFYRNR